MGKKLDNLLRNIPKKDLQVGPYTKIFLGLYNPLWLKINFDFKEVEENEQSKEES